jgi:predicted O-methyltransferase YrrM
MTDRERVVKKLRQLIKAAHAENYDFIYIDVGKAKTIVRLLEEQELKLDKGGGTDDG